MDFLLEIGVEEIPSGYIEPAMEVLARRAASELETRRISFSGIHSFSTPRRLALLVRGLAEKQADVEKEAVGPSEKAAFDAHGKPNKAAQGFARSQGVPVEALFIKDTDKGKYVCARVSIQGRPTKDVLPELIPSLVLSVPFPKTMTWLDPSVRFGRPIRWVAALLDADVVPFEVAGVKSGRITFGNRFLAPEPIRLNDPSEYVPKLEKAWVIADLSKRKAIVTRLVEEEAQKKGGRIVEDRELPDIVTNLVEFPVAVVGSFDKAFLELPRDVVITAMREHQRYFALEDGSGKLLPYFVTLRNGGSDGEENVRVGNERVLRARLDDARFYWEKDVSIGIERQLELLRDVVWQESLGSVYDKGKRLSELAASVVAEWDKSKVDVARRAALLCKTDLVSEMVKDGKEFTTLQGVMGGEYAARAGELPPVVTAVKEHYLPRFPGDSLPATLSGAAVGIADRLDEIVGCFSTGKIPSGSEDPYGVRRQANGIMRILIEKGLHTSLSRGLERAIQLLSGQFKVRDSLREEVSAFLEQRLAFILSEMGLEQDVIDSVLSVDSDDPYRSWLKAKAVAEWKPDAQFSGVVLSFKRVSNILKAETYEPALREALDEEVERSLYDGVADVSTVVSDLMSQVRYEDVVARLLSLKGPIDAFFDGVLVMDPDHKVRARRLSLLAMVRSVFLTMADFSKLSESPQEDS